MEPHATTAAVIGGTITVWTCSQEVFELRTVMASLFGVPESKMRIICTKVGGGFGGKIEPRLEPVAIALTMKAHKPVKIVMTRTDEFTAAAGSTPATVKLRTGVMVPAHVQHTFNGKDIIAMRDEGVVINNAQDFLELIMNLPSDRIVFYKENFDESFFDLRSGLAGEILQKVSNYSRKLSIVGDYSRYASRSLNDFMFESNQGNKVMFVDSLDEALRRLSA